jgi:hypothetical protein
MFLAVDINLIQEDLEIDKQSIQFVNMTPNCRNRSVIPTALHEKELKSACQKRNFEKLFADWH